MKLGHLNRLATPFGGASTPAAVAVLPASPDWWRLLRQLRLRRAAAPVAEPVDFLAAVKAAFLASPAAATIAGGLFTALPGKTAVLPFVVFAEVSATLKLKTSDSSVRRTRVRYKVYGDDPEALAAAGDAIEDAFANTTLRFVGGWTAPFFVGDRTHGNVPAAMSNVGKAGFFAQIEFTVDVKRGA